MYNDNFVNRILSNLKVIFASNDYWTLAFVLILSLLLDGIYYLVTWYFSYFARWIGLDSLQHPPDISYKLKDTLRDSIYSLSYLIVSLNLIISPLGIYFSATNNRLSLPIRLLATAENIIRFAYSVCYMPYIYCTLAPTYLLKKYQCGWPFYWFSMGLFNKIILYYPLYDMAQHCQLMISINRFFAVHFNGFLFRYTLKWPLVQMALPFVIRIAVAQVKISFFPPNLMEGGIYFDDYIVNFFNFLMCSLDFMTWRRMKVLRRDGKITRSELLLLFQMLTSSFLIITNTIILNFTQNICSYFFGASVSELLYSTPYSFQAIFFVGINSITSVFFLRKPKEKSINSSITSVNTKTTNMRSD